MKVYILYCERHFGFPAPCARCAMKPAKTGPRLIHLPASPNHFPESSRVGRDRALEAHEQRRLDRELAWARDVTRTK